MSCRTCKGGLWELRIPSQLSTSPGRLLPPAIFHATPVPICHGENSPKMHYAKLSILSHPKTQSIKSLLRATESVPQPLLCTPETSPCPCPCPCNNHCQFFSLIVYTHELMAWSETFCPFSLSTPIFYFLSSFVAQAGHHASNPGCPWHHSPSSSISSLLSQPRDMQNGGSCIQQVCPPLSVQVIPS